MAYSRLFATDHRLVGVLAERSLDASFHWLTRVIEKINNALARATVPFQRPRYSNGRQAGKAVGSSSGCRRNAGLRGSSGGKRVSLASGSLR